MKDSGDQSKGSSDRKNKRRERKKRREKETRKEEIEKERRKRKTEKGKNNGSKEVAEEWEIWDKKEEIAKLEEEAKKLVPECSHKWIYIFGKKQSERMSTRKP